MDRLVGEHDLGPLYEADNARKKGRFLLLMLRREVSPPLKTMLAVRNDLRHGVALAPLGFVPIEQVADASGTTGFATELFPGETLRELLDRGPMQMDRALLLSGMLANALFAAHGKGLLHGDLRPENVLLVHPEARKPYGGRAMLLGHTLYRLRPPPGPGPRSAPAHAARLRYCPPEQVAQAAQAARGGKGAVFVEPDARGDVFALGAILYECLAGHPAFAPDPSSGDAQEEDPKVLLRRLAAGPAPLVPNQATGLSPEVARVVDVVIAGACNPDPRLRIADMSEFVRALRQVARTGPAPPRGQPGPLHRRAPRSAAPARPSGIRPAARQRPVRRPGGPPEAGRPGARSRRRREP